ncbi:hypothetical protein PMAYCL1PPCAC_27026, partial [Pristionchus mayeri]
YFTLAELGANFTKSQSQWSYVAGTYPDHICKDTAVTERVNPCTRSEQYMRWMNPYTDPFEGPHAGAAAYAAFITCKAGLWILWCESTSQKST